MARTLEPLVEAARSGDPQALDTLARCADRFSRIFHGSLSRTVRIRYGSTMDFVLEGVAEALARLPEFEYQSDEEFYAWVAGFIRNRILGAGRKARSKKRGPRPLPIDAVLGDVKASDTSPSEALHASELRCAVAQALLELQVEHPLEMEVVVRKVFEGQSWPRIKEELDLSSEKRARTLFSRALDRLRPVLTRISFQRFPVAVLRPSFTSTRAISRSPYRPAILRMISRSSRSVALPTPERGFGISKLVSVPPFQYTVNLRVWLSSSRSRISSITVRMIFFLSSPGHRSLPHTLSKFSPRSMIAASSSALSSRPSDS